ncbi:MAG: HAD family hydrolase [Trueperella sp.]|nr:HAD family hydrolase [Trueperella sp.]
MGSSPIGGTLFSWDNGLGSTGSVVSIEMMTANNTPTLDLTALPAEVMDIDHAVFDIDGTLTGADSATSDETVAALRRLDDAGIPVTLATGRILNGGANLARRAGIHAWVIAAGGGVVWDGENIVDAHHMPRAEVEALTEFGRDWQLMPFYFGEVDVFAHGDLLDEGGVRILQTASEGQDFKEVAEMDWDKVTKVSYAGPAERVDKAMVELVKKFPQAVRSHDKFIDVPLQGITKWQGIATALWQRELAPRTALGVGDSENDISWLTQIGMPIAAPLATPDVLAVCRYRLPEMTDSVAALIDAILAAK